MWHHDDSDFDGGDDKDNDYDENTMSMMNMLISSILQAAAGEAWF